MKTKLGISVAMMAAATYLLGLFSGYLALVLVVGYVLICESDEWLKKSVVKALAILLSFSLMSALIGLIPNLITLIDDVANIFDESFNIVVVSRIITLINTVLNLLEKLLLLFLAFLATKSKTFKVPVLDNILEKHM